MKAGSKEVGYVRANVSNLEIATNSGNAGNLVFRTNGGDRMLVGANGRVAINYTCNACTAKCIWHQ